MNVIKNLKFNNKTENIDLINKIKINGIVKIKNFLDQEEILSVKSILNYYKKPKAHPDTIFPVSKSNYMIKLLKLDFRKIIYSLKLNKITKNKNLNIISNTFFETKTKLNMMDGYFSKKSNASILEWHCDQPFYSRLTIDETKIRNQHDNRELKVFVYLTKVFRDNGCVCYIPGSHKFVYELKKLIYERKIPYMKLKFLNEFYKWISNDQNYKLLEDNFEKKEILNEFMNKINFLKTETNTTKYDYDMEEGDAIIFDENGFHKGTKPLFTDRLVLRYHYSRINRV